MGGPQGDDRPPDAPGGDDTPERIGVTTPTPAEEPAAEGEAALAYQQRARLAEDRLGEVLAAYRKMKAETESFRERQQRNLERRYEQRHERLLVKFIDILDNLDRGLEAAQVSYAGQPLLEGMILVRTQLLQVLKSEGLERIPVLGLPFDPHVSEAVGTLPVGEIEQNAVVMKELQRGYRMKDKIARPSRVVIGEYRAGYKPPLQPSSIVDEAMVGAPAAEPAEATPAAAAMADDGPSLEEIVSKVAGSEDELLPEYDEAEEEDPDRS